MRLGLCQRDLVLLECLGGYLPSIWLHEVLLRNFWLARLSEGPAELAYAGFEVCLPAEIVEAELPEGSLVPDRLLPPCSFNIDPDEPLVPVAHLPCDFRRRGVPSWPDVNRLNLRNFSSCAWGRLAPCLGVEALAFGSRRGVAVLT